MPKLAYKEYVESVEQGNTHLIKSIRHTAIEANRGTENGKKDY